MTAIPSLPSAVSAGGKIKAADINLLIAYLNFQRNPPRFKGSITSATALTANSPIKFPAISDTASGWNASTGQYTFQYPGTYLLQFQMKWGAVTPGTIGGFIVVNGSNALYSVAPPNAAFSGPVINSSLSGISAGDVLSAQVQTGFTTQSDSPADNNFLILTWTGQ